MKIAHLIQVLGALVVVAHALPINDDRPPSDDELPSPPAANDAPSPVGRIPGTLSLPSNATAIRADITDTFSCDGRIYGYYADVDNDCQIFHICLPVTYADGKENMFRWSFVCPDETIFSQELFTCMRAADWAGDCSESAKFVELNRQFGATTAGDEQQSDAELAAAVPAVRAPAAPIAEVAAVPAESVPVSVKVWTSVDQRPAVLTSSEELLPVYDADTSETQAFGLFKVLGAGGSAESSQEVVAVRADAEPIPVHADVVPESQPISVVEEGAASEAADSAASIRSEASEPVSVAQEITPVGATVVQPAESAVAFETAIVPESGNDIDAAVAAAIATATEAEAEAVEQESTELWTEQYTQSLYNGGSTIDDNVEVNAIAEGTVEEVATEPTRVSSAAR